MILVENKFNLKEEIYSIWQQPIKNKCGLCEGEGSFLHKEESIRCPQCRGTGVVVNEKYRAWEVMSQKLTISSVKATVNRHDVNIRYKACGYGRVEANLFHTKEEAQNRCNELNYVKSEMNNNES